MPSTINYTQLSTVLPPQRLQMYQKVFETQNDIELHGAYIWSLKVAASIQPLLSILEVTLRNAIHYHATDAIGPSWYDTLHTKTRKGWKKAPRDKSNIHWHKAEVERIKRKVKSKTPPKGLSTHDQLVAKMDFGFWDNLLKECFSINGDSHALWPQCMPNVFPNLPKGFTNSSVQRRVSVLRELRNDIAHNSPIWKNKNVRNAQSAIHYINQQIDEVMALIHWLSAEKVNWIEVHRLKAEAKRIASIKYLHLYQRKTTGKFSEPTSRYKRSFHTRLKQLGEQEFDVIELRSGGLVMVTKVALK